MPADLVLELRGRVNSAPIGGLTIATTPLTSLDSPAKVEQFIHPGGTLVFSPPTTKCNYVVMIFPAVAGGARKLGFITDTANTFLFQMSKLAGWMVLPIDPANTVAILIILTVPDTLPTTVYYL
jgi:hypothetical protein